MFLLRIGNALFATSPLLGLLILFRRPYNAVCLPAMNPGHGFLSTRRSVKFHIHLSVMTLMFTSFSPLFPMTTLGYSCGLMALLYLTQLGRGGFGVFVFQAGIRQRISRPIHDIVSNYDSEIEGLLFGFHFLGDRNETFKLSRCVFFVIVSQHCVLSQVFTLAVRTTLVFAVP
jgi:hypothetical protein